MKKALIIAALLIAICATFAFSACLYPSSLHKIDYDGMELIFEDNGEIIISAAVQTAAALFFNRIYPLFF